MIVRLVGWFGYFFFEAQMKHTALGNKAYFRLNKYTFITFLSIFQTDLALWSGRAQSSNGFLDFHRTFVAHKF